LNSVFQHRLPLKALSKGKPKPGPLGQYSFLFSNHTKMLNLLPLFSNHTKMLNLLPWLWTHTVLNTYAKTVLLIFIINFQWII